MHNMKKEKFAISGIVSKVTTSITGELKVTIDLHSDESNKAHFAKLLDLAVDPRVILAQIEVLDG